MDWRAGRGRSADAAAVARNSVVRGLTPRKNVSDDVDRLNRRR